ncbi:hypothetical protein GLX27_004027 [Malassezia furfur]|uniref:triacylglycerol lipase n=1 Tax=Malassezia furfur TaxID=55194 RepID=A0ABY8EUW9_MALFU|nr:hypothetical protein CBS14141_004185 [Malassezia furfur]WFD49347.1 hypothetical protein GLX27_004027 [Malassezia furfur]
MLLHVLFAAVLALLAVVGAEPQRRVRHVRRDGAKAPLSPTLDPFYVAPNGWEKTKPGTILSSREIQASFSTTQKMNLDKAYQILYRTSGTSTDQPSYTVTTVLVPHNANTDSLVMVMPYEDSNFVECAPSYKIQLGAPAELNPLQSLEELMWTSMLNDGWILTVPDHEGPLSAFSSGMLEGYASLDALRATLAFEPLKLPSDTKIVGTGYSGGAIAGGWAASLQNTYAPELNVLGWAIGGTPANITATFYDMDSTMFAGLTAAGLAGIVDSYPEANDYVGSVITETGNTALQYTREHCMSDIIMGLRNVNTLNKGFVSNTQDFLTSPSIVGLLNNLTMGTNADLVPKAPVYMYHSVNDEVISFSMANRTAQLWCDQGATMQFQAFTGLEMGHVSTELLNSPFVLKFIRDRMANSDFGTGCNWTTTVDPMWQPDVLGAKLTEVFNALTNLLGSAIGPGDHLLKEHIQQGHY